MSEVIKPLAFSVQSVTANELVIKVKNITRGVLDRPTTIELYCPKDILDEKIRDAADAACGIPGATITLDTLVTGAEGKFSVWGRPQSANHAVIIAFMNDQDKMGVEIPPSVWAAGAELVIRIPLDSEALRSDIIQIPYAYEDDIDPRVDGKLELKASDIDWTPKISLKSDHATPTMIAPMTEVLITWSIENGVSAELRGPLPGGNANWSLPITGKKSSGSFKIKAVGQMNYLLEAELKGPTGRANIRVTKSLLLDVAKGKYAYLAARPERTLPYGRVEIDWAAWGVMAVSIEGNGGQEDIELTDKTLNGTYQGVGFWPTTAKKFDQETDIRIELTIEMPAEPRRVEASTSFKVVPWRTMTDSVFTGAPIGLAVAVPKIALLTTTGLWLATIGETDSSDAGTSLAGGKLDFSRSTKIVEPKAWLALAAFPVPLPPPSTSFENKFVALRQTSQDTLQVALYKVAGTPAEIVSDEIEPVDLPPDVRPLLGRSGTVFDLAVFNNTVYVVVEGSVDAGPLRLAFAVRFDPVTKKGSARTELLLEQLAGYRLLTFDNTLYALNRESGEMVRFGLKEGKLEAYTAASAVTQGASMVKQGLLVPVGRVLAVLSPTSVPSLASLAGFGLRNVLKSKSRTALKVSGPLPQDLVYNPQNDRWGRCGHGLDAVAGVVAYRSGRSQRLWFIGPDKKTWTLTAGSEVLFAHDYRRDGDTATLPAVFNETVEYRFVNNTGVQFVPMNETCFKAGLKPFSSTGPVLLTSPMPTAPTTPRTELVTLRYNKAVSTSTATLRFLAKRGPGAKYDYVFEVTLSGPPRFLDSSAVFKRLAVNAQGGVSVVEVPGRRDAQMYSGLIEVMPRELGNGIRLRIRNGTPYALWLRSPDSLDPAEHEKKYSGEEIKIRYDSAPFSIYAHGAGELPVDVDFAMPNGVEISPGSEAQKQRIRIRWDGPRIFAAEAVSINDAHDAYEFTLRYKVERHFCGAFMGDGATTSDGASIYLPLAEPPDVTKVKIFKIDANNLQIIGTAQVPGRNVFCGPNSVVVLEDRVLGVFNREHVAVFDHNLRIKPGFPVTLFGYNLLTNFKGSGPYIFTVGMRETPTSDPRYSYHLDSWFYLDAARENLHHYTIGNLPSNKGFGPGRVPGAPPWVALNAICPMDAMAICVEGGVIGFDRKDNWRQIDVALPGTGRAEAIHVDPNEHLIFAAHSKASGSGLMISRINLAQPSEKLTIELPGSPYHMVTDSKPPTSPNLEYNRARAVSLVATSDTLFVSNGTKIYVFDKTRLTERHAISLGWPMRLIQVRKPVVPTDRTYGAPPNSYLVWAIGSLYNGDGQTISEDKFMKTLGIALYKFAVVL